MLIFHTDNIAEHGHSHGSSHSHGTASVATSKPASIASSEDETATMRAPSPSRSRSVARKRSDSYASFSGHPAVTRATLVQVAQDIALASSPPTARHGPIDATHDTPSRHASVADEAAVASPAAHEVHEDTPLLHSHDHSDDHDHGSTSSQSLNAKEQSHGHSHGGSMNMQALLLHVSLCLINFVNRT